MLYHFETEQWIPVVIEEVFRFFANPDNLPRIMPPATDTRLLQVNLVPPASGDTSMPTQGPVAGIGSEIVTSFRVMPYLPFRRQWTARIIEFEWNHFFADVQQEGPFKSFHHRHELSSEKRGAKQGTVIRDIIDYEIGFGFVDAIANVLISRELRKAFAFRQGSLQQILLG